ncbi:HlyD family secretion protein [Francisella sp. 19X1-34]|uniref:HlyD family secretion protein n=1 Tax=Francisella sp. 19X1-34 TaxID=3087177 RepID=UPI002E300F7B|nr:HlyD family secretion protein [Francisella sp. 19X1-34]MED7787877.1 HlyD family secretion protein [Francisella sp. 19X1-34]
MNSITKVLASIIYVIKSTYRNLYSWVAKHKFWSFIIFSFIFYICYHSSGYFFVFNNDAYVFAKLSRIAPVVSGRINKIYIHDNQFVKQGQLLLALDQKPFEARLTYIQGMMLKYKYQTEEMNSKLKAQIAILHSTHANLELDKVEWQRFKKLLKEGAVSLEQYDIKNANYQESQDKYAKAYEDLINIEKEKQELTALLKSYQGKLTLAKYNLDHSKIYADKDGFINHLRVYQGDYAKVGEVLFGFVEANSWQVIANIRADNLPMIQAGKTVWVYISSYPWQLFEGKIVGVGKAVARYDSPQDRALPYVKPVLSWVRYPYRTPVYIKINHWNKTQDNNISLFMGSDAKVFILP